MLPWKKKRKFERQSQTEWLKQQTFISHSPGGWEVQVKVVADVVSSEGPLPGLQVAVFLLYPYMVESKETSLVSLLKGTNTIHESSTFQTPHFLILPR